MISEVEVEPTTTESAVTTSTSIVTSTTSTTTSSSTSTTETSAADINNNATIGTRGEPRYLSSSQLSPVKGGRCPLPGMAPSLCRDQADQCTSDEECAGTSARENQVIMAINYFGFFDSLKSCKAVPLCVVFPCIISI